MSLAGMLRNQRSPLVARLPGLRRCPFPQWLGLGTEIERRRPSLLAWAATR